MRATAPDKLHSDMVEILQETAFADLESTKMPYHSEQYWIRYIIVFETGFTSCL